MDLELLQIDAGRVVEYGVWGADDGELLVFHVGAPSAATEFPTVVRAAADRGYRTLIYSRPGYGASTRWEGRRYADEAIITAALADHLGHRSFIDVGISAGGPAALACAALLPDRVRGCVALASPAPPAEVGEEWYGWYGAADADELRRIVTPERDSFVTSYEAAAPVFASMTREKLAADYPSDRPMLDDPAGFGTALADSMRRGVSAGIWGWFDDIVAMAGDWGFSVRDMAVPVVIRHGEADPLVDVRHGRWLAAAIPGATAQFIPGLGHAAAADPLAPALDALLERVS